MTFTADNLSLESLGLPIDEVSIRHWPEARDAAIKMIDTSMFFYGMPDAMQHLALGFFITGYIMRAHETYKPW